LSEKALRGLFPILATPFDSSGALDERSLRRLVRFQLECGVDGLGLFGFASEAFALTEGERDTILRAVREEADGALPLVVGAGGMGTLPAIEQGLRAVEGGADALMVLPPFMAKPGPQYLVEFYGELAGAVGVPVMVQDAPANTGVAMPPALMKELAALPGVDYVKVETQPTAVKVQQIAEAVGGGMAVFGGQNALFVLEEMDRGAVGTMPACEFADGLRAVLDARAEGRKREARELYNRLLSLIRYGLQPGVAWAVHKEVLVARGLIDHAAVRSPARPLTPHVRRSLLEVVETLPMDLPRRHVLLA